MDYTTFSGFEDLYLEDSWVLSISATYQELVLKVEFALLASHPSYQRPLPNEQHCYKVGYIRFPKVESLVWTDQLAVHIADASGETDLGSILEFQSKDGRYVLFGGFGEIEVVSQLPIVEFA